MRRSAFYDIFSAEAHKPIRQSMERVIVLDPVWAPAWVGLAYTYFDEFRLGFNPQREHLERALKAAQRAASVDKDNDLVQLIIVTIRFHRHELDIFYVHGQRAIEINPNNSSTLADLGDN